MSDHTTQDTSREIPYGHCRCGCGQKTRISTQNVRRLGWIKGQPTPYINGHNARKPRPKRNHVKLCECGCGQPAPIATYSDATRGYVLGEPMRYIVGHQVKVRPIRPLEDRFWEKVNKDDPNGCWIWTGATNDKGYGQIQRGDRGEGRISTHRLAWQLQHGPIPEGLDVCHECDNPPCCNPAHLFLGTHSDNMVDMYSKGRANKKPRHGEQNHAAKLTADQVREIRLLCAKGMTQNAVAQQFGVSEAAIQKIVKRKNWKHL